MLATPSKEPLVTADPPARPLLDDRALQNAAALFGMLAAPARLQILWLLLDGERDVSTLAADLDQTVAGVSQHLAKLKLAGLVRARRAGRRQLHLIDDPRIADLLRCGLDGQASRNDMHRRSAG
ncbi:MAG: helix-turn-helix transcriptional regulator [Pseudonocardia sp.]|nr:helix-turn-helix transcriptional regulator [Pseudonocardia sp.]